MTAEKSTHSPNKTKRPFTGCVELNPPQPAFIEFVTSTRLWGVPIRQLDYFVLGENPLSDGKKTSPTDLLILAFETRIVLLFGWRLELMLDPLMNGRIRRIHAEQHLGTLIIEEPWVSEIKIIPRRESVPL
jgi:hypothetical protein